MGLCLSDIFYIHQTAQSGRGLNVCPGIDDLILGHLGGEKTKRLGNDVLRFDADLMIILKKREV